MKKLDKLLAEIRACRLCEPNLPLGANPVVRAKPSARILIVGQAPGRRVHATGLPFNDPSGDRLRDWMGVDRDTFYDEKRIAILPMGFCYPGTGNSGDLPPRAECAAHWRKKLLAQLPHIELTLAIGQYAIAYHIPNSPYRTLTETVKHWQDYWPALLPMPHPSPRNNMWLRRNLWFEKEIISILQKRIESLLQ